MTFDPDDVTGSENQAANHISHRFSLLSNSYINGQNEPGTTQPSGVMIKGPFNQNIWSIKMREWAEAVSAVEMEATYALDYVEERINVSPSVTPYHTFIDSATVWETVNTTDLVALGQTSFNINWSSAALGMSAQRTPTAVRFYFNTAGSNVRIEIEEGIL